METSIWPSIRKYIIKQRRIQKEREDLERHRLAWCMTFLKNGDLEGCLMALEDSAEALATFDREMGTA